MDIIIPNLIKNNNILTFRHKRNQSLQESDKYMLQDYPITDFQRSLVINYRKELRDFFQTSVVVNWVFTLENQEFPSLLTFPDLNQIQIPYIEVPPIDYANITSNIAALPITYFELSSNILVE